MATIKFNPNATESETPVQRFECEPPSAVWLESLDQNPLISPNFADTLRMRADWFVYEWVNKHAPAAIRELQHCASNLTAYEMEFRASKGYVSEDSNSSILKVVTNTINALDDLGDEWTSTTP